MALIPLNRTGSPVLYEVDLTRYWFGLVSMTRTMLVHADGLADLGDQINQRWRARRPWLRSTLVTLDGHGYGSVLTGVDANGKGGTLRAVVSTRRHGGAP